MSASSAALAASVAPATPAGRAAKRAESVAKPRGVRAVEHAERLVGGPLPRERPRAGLGRGAHALALGVVLDQLAHAGHELGRLVGQHAGLAVDDRLGEAADAHRRARGAARAGLHDGQAPALGGRGRERHPRRRVQLALLRFVDEAVERDAVAEPAGGDLGLEGLAVVALAGDVEMRARHALEHVEQQLEPLVALEAAEVEQARGRRTRPASERVALDPAVHDRDVLGRDPELDERPCTGVRDGHELRAGVEVAERERLQQPRGDRAAAAELLHVHVAVDVVDDRDARDRQPPQRSEEGDAVDDLDHHVDVADRAALDQRGRAREDREPAAGMVELEVRSRALDALGARDIRRPRR